MNFSGMTHSMRSLGILFLISAFCVLFAPRNASAALLYFDPGELSIHRGDITTVNLRLDTDEGECINTIDAVIKYDPSIRAVDVSRGDSILSLWVEPPIIDPEQNTIRFAGGIPGGYCGRIPGDPSLTNIILKLVFRSPGLSIGGDSNAIARVWVDESAQVLLHDGFGSNASLRLQDARITLFDSPGSTISDPWTGEVQSDKEPPSDFVITLAREESAFSGKYFITFNALDKQSGIDHYEVMEEPFDEFNAFKWGRVGAPWVRSESPYVLIDQSLNSTIRVKAIDKAGNERVAVLVPDTALRSMSINNLILLGLVCGVLALVLGLTFYAVRKRKQRRMTTETLQDSQNHE